MIKQSKGITLIALVLTIIIILILAGISIQAITNTGIFTQANNAKRMVDLELGLPFFTLMIFLLC